MGEPQITRRAFHVIAGSNTPVSRVVIHATCPGIGYPSASRAGRARDTANYFQSRGAGGSAHYIVDVGGNEEHCLRDNEIAWHAPPNSHSIGIEICGESTYTRSQWLSGAVRPALEAAAARTRELCHRHGIPVRRLSVHDLLAGRHGICGHIDVSNAWHKTDHSDPGPHFPWDVFMGLVTGTAAPKPTPPPAPAHNEGDDDMALQGQLNTGEHAITPIGWPGGSRKAIGFLADTGLAGLGADGKPQLVTLRVAVLRGKSWKVEKTLTVDSAEGKTVLPFTDYASVGGVSVRREGSGDDIPVSWDAS